MKKLLSLIVAVASAAVLTACGGGGSPTVGAATDTRVAIDASNGAATARSVVNQEFAFGAVPAFGTTGTTTLKFTNTAATPAFSIASGGSTATGVTEFGSCRFNVVESTFSADSPLAAGKTVVIANCALVIATRGTAANGLSQQRSATFVLGGSTSNPITVTVSISEDGVVTVNGRVVATIVVRELTGA